MTPHSIRPALEELERTFKVLALLFKQKMPLPVITIQGRHRPSNAVGWFRDGNWHNGKPQGLPEINICAERLNRPLQEIAATLLHEMCHYANALDGIRDYSGSYHNRKFKKRCESIGLVCERSETSGHGWSATSLSPSLREVVLGLNLNPEKFRLCRDSSPSSETRLKPWTCACSRIWAAVEVDLTCNKCGAKLKRAGRRGTSPDQGAELPLPLGEGGGEGRAMCVRSPAPSPCEEAKPPFPCVPRRSLETKPVKTLTAGRVEA